MTIEVYSWLIDWMQCMKNCLMGMISGWVQKLTEHRGQSKYMYVLQLTEAQIQTLFSIFFQWESSCASSYASPSFTVNLHFVHRTSHLRSFHMTLCIFLIRLFWSRFSATTDDDVDRLAKRLRFPQILLHQTSHDFRWFFVFSPCWFNFRNFSSVFLPSNITRPLVHYSNLHDLS